MPTKPCTCLEDQPAPAPLQASVMEPQPSGAYLRRQALANATNLVHTLGVDTKGAVERQIAAAQAARSAPIVAANAIMDRPAPFPGPFSSPEEQQNAQLANKAAYLSKQGEFKQALGKIPYDMARGPDPEYEKALARVQKEEKAGMFSAGYLKSLKK